MLEKWPFFDQNHGLTPLEKFQFFDFWNFFFFIDQKGAFLLQKIIKHIFLAYIALKKNLEKWSFLNQNHGITPLKTCQLFYFLKLFFFSFSLERRFFVLEYHKRHFSGLYCVKKKKLEKWQFLDQNHGLTPLKKCLFFDFLNFLFLQPRKACFRSRIL